MLSVFEKTFGKAATGNVYNLLIIHAITFANKAFSKAYWTSHDPSKNCNYSLFHTSYCKNAPTSLTIHI